MICYDTDQPGKENAIKVAQKLANKGINARIVNLPEDYKDICEYFTGGHSKDDFIKLCEAAKPFNNKEADNSQSDEEDEEGESKKSLVLQIVEEVTDSEAIFFHDQNRNGYVVLSGDGKEILKISSKLFKQWLTRYVWEGQKRIPSSDSINNVIQALEGKAIFDGPCHELNVRICESDNALWYDLGDGSVVRVVQEGWAIIDKPPILFKRYSHQLPQISPLRDVDLKDICNFVNLCQV